MNGLLEAQNFHSTSEKLNDAVRRLVFKRPVPLVLPLPVAPVRPLVPVVIATPVAQAHVAQQCGPPPRTPSDDGQCSWIAVRNVHGCVTRYDCDPSKVSVLHNQYIQVGADLVYQK